MKNVFYLSATLLLLSCTENSGVQKNEIPHNENVVEDVVNQSSDPFKSSYRSNDGLVEDIYKQLLLKDKNLSKLDNDIKNIREYSEEIMSEYRLVLSKSDLFYQDAANKTKNFSDSLLAKRIDSLSAASSSKYDARTQNVRNTLKTAQQNLNRINDEYDAFKIKRAMAEIEKYQNTKSFDLKNLNDLLKKQQETLNNLSKTK